MPRDMLLSDDPSPINRRSITTPHRLSEQECMEGSNRRFYAPVMFDPPDREKERNRTGEANRPMTAHLPTIQWIQKRKNCSVCNKPTHLSWQSPCRDPTGRIVHSSQPHNKYWLCQGCAKRRGPPYRLAVSVFL